MIKAKLNTGDVIIGLSHENLDRLKAGEPIRFSLTDLGISNNDMFIIAGKDEDTLYSENLIDLIKVGHSKIHTT